MLQLLTSSNIRSAAKAFKSTTTIRCAHLTFKEIAEALEEMVDLWGMAPGCTSTRIDEEGSQQQNVGDNLLFERGFEVRRIIVPITTRSYHKLP